MRETMKGVPLTAPEELSTTPVHAQRWRSEPEAVVLAIRGPIGRDDISSLCQHVEAALDASDTPVVVCDVGALGDPDAVVLDALVRMQLTARRAGGDVLLRNARGRLFELLALTGLCAVLPVDAATGRGEAADRTGGRASRYRERS